MENNNQLDAGFEEVPLDEGFEEIPLTDHEQAAMAKFIAPPPKVSKMESASEGLAHGGTFGFSPRMGGALGAMLEKLSGTPMGPEKFPLVPGAENSEKKKLADLYNEYKTASEKRRDIAKESNPVTFHAAEFAGGMASPLNKIGAVGQLGKNAPMISKMGASALGGARMGTVAGLSQSPDLMNPKEDVEAMGMGLGMGGVLGAAAPPVGAALATGARMTGSGLKSVFGPVPEMVSKGMQAGAEGLPNLASDAGQIEATQMRGEFSNRFIQDLNKILKSNATNKRQMIAKAMENNQMAPEEAVQEVTQKYLDMDPKLNDPVARRELAELKELILTAREGELKNETIRQYTGAMPPRTLPSNESPIVPGKVEREYPFNEASGESSPPMPSGQPQLAPHQESGLVPSEEIPTGEAFRMQPPPEPTPSGFAGYEPIHKATVDAGDENARKAFQHKINEKLADERALGRNHNDNPIEIEEIPIEGSDKVRLVAKRAKVEENVDEFKDQAAELAQKQKEEARLQALLDRQQQEQMKFKQQQEAELSKPQFVDVQQQVRAGDRNLQNPEELYQLYKNLQSKSQFSEGRGFASEEMNKMAGNAAKDITGLIKGAVPETQAVDAKLTAFNNIAERLGIDTNKLKLPGGEGEKARADAMKKLLGMINPEDISDNSTMGRDAIDYAGSQLEKIDPNMAKQFAQQVAQHAEAKGLVQEFSRPYEPSGINWLFNAMRRNASKAAYGMGHAAGTEVNKMKPLMQSSKQLFQRYTPESLQTAASKAMSSGDASLQKFGQALSKLSSADERTRNSMLFLMEQNAGYRQMMDKVFPQESEKTSQAKDKNLDLYK